MTLEQKQTLKRCGQSLKAVFPDLTGYVKFDMRWVSDKVEVSVCYTNIKVKE
jgi:hypothetical protein